MPAMTDEGRAEAEGAGAHEADVEPGTPAIDSLGVADEPREESGVADEAIGESVGESVGEAEGDSEVATTAAKRRLPSVGPRTAAVAAAFAALLAGCGFLGWKVWDQQQLNQAREQAQQTAVAYAQILTSIDSNNVDDNFKQVLDGATGEFKDMYSQSSVQLRQLLVENKATAHGVVVDSAVQEASKNKAVVLLFVDQSVSNTKLPDPRIDRSRMKMTLEKADGRWRASKVELP